MENINDDASIHPLSMTMQKDTGTESNTYENKRKVLGYKKKTATTGKTATPKFRRLGTGGDFYGWHSQ